jgi:hypothetical protein
MIVQFYQLKEKGPEIIGTIALKNGILVAAPADSVPLRNVLRDVVRVEQGPGEPPLKLNAQQHPDAFLAALPKAYVGTYFWCRAIPRS